MTSTETLAQRLARQLAENNPGQAVMIRIGTKTTTHMPLGEREKQA